MSQRSLRRRSAPRASVIFAHALVRNDVLSACGTCHDVSTPKDVLHRQVGDDCGSCHGFEAWTPATFEHEKYFRFDRHHPRQRLSCRAIPTHSIATPVTGATSIRSGSIAREHREEGIADFEDCVECHRSGDEDEAKRRYSGAVAGIGTTMIDRRLGQRG